ncbi:hypothetical protein [Salana multivorans]
MSRPVTRSLLALPLVAVLGLGLAACSGGDGEEEQSAGRPTAEEFSAFFAAGSEATGLREMEQDKADCWGAAFADSDLSDVTLRALIDEDVDYQPEDENELGVLEELYTSTALECGLPTGEQPSGEESTEEAPSEEPSGDAEPSESASE